VVNSRQNLYYTTSPKLIFGCNDGGREHERENLIGCWRDRGACGCSRTWYDVRREEQLIYSHWGTWWLSV